MSVYKQEKERLGQIPRGGGGGGDFQWLDIPTPAGKGGETVKRVRIIPRLPRGEDGQPDVSRPYPAFWVRVAVHRLTVDGEDKQFNCPDDPTNPSAPTTCPICKLRKELQDARNSAYDEVIKSLYPRVRCFCNVIDLEDPGSHWKDDGNGGWTVQPYVWGYSQTVHTAILDICISKGPVEDHQLGRDIKIVKKKIGKRKIDIRYSIGEASDQKPLDEQLMGILYAAHGLEGLEKSTAPEVLRDVAALLDPRAGSHRSSSPPPAASAPPPPTPSYAPPPPRAAAPAQPQGPTYFYDGPAGQQENQDVTMIARLIVGSGNEGGHAVWAEGWDDWVDAMQVPEIAQAVAAQRPAPAAPPPSQPPGYRPGGGYQVGGGGPPAPPSAPPPPSGPPSPPQRAAGPPAPPSPPKKAAPPPPAPRGKAPPPPPKPPGGPSF